MILAFRLLMYAIGGYLSMACATEIGSDGKYPLIGFAVGPIFGVVVLLWECDSARALVGSASLRFLLLSTVTWCLVDWLLHLARGDYFDWDILVGSILLPCAHVWVFRPSWRRTLSAIVLSFVGFESWRLMPDSAPDLLRRVVNAAALWQGGYLLAMYGPERGASSEKGLNTNG
jgi:hypothetical protein